jgi:D-glycero-alpha-D-manno-heptose 1-phosphate guanylyltransferase
MALTQAIILAGGLGTRLRSAVPNLPKCMAPVNGKPFIAYVINELQQQGIHSFILSLGYKSEAIIEYVTNQYPNLHIQFSIEEEPLGTGGAIQLACTKATTPNVVVCNGDTLFKVNMNELSNFHVHHKAHCTLTLKPMQKFERYGVVTLNNDASISSFKEKKFYETGLINGGVYALNVHSFLQEQLPEKFSFEKEYLETMYHQRNLVGLVQQGYFIDIGIPEDFEKAQNDFKNL